MTPTQPETSRYDRRRDVVALHNHGDKPKAIAAELGAPERSVYRIIKEYKERGHVHDLPRSGRPPTLSASDKKIIEKTVEEHPELALCDITNTVTLDISHDVSHVTVDKALKEVGFTLHVKRKKPFLKASHKRDRVEWCARRRRWNRNWWRRVI